MGGFNSKIMAQMAEERRRFSNDEGGIMCLNFQDIAQQINTAAWNGMNYTFFDKYLIDQADITSLRLEGFSVVVGMGEHARIKVTW